MPNDIDMLIVYNPLERTQIKMILNFRILVSNRIEVEMKQRADIILLNSEEYVETDYKLLNKILIFP